MYNYTIIAYGIKVPEEFGDLVSECDLTEFDLMIHPYNGSSSEYNIGIGYEISDTDFGGDFIKDILDFKEVDYFSKFENDKQVLISEILNYKSDIIDYFPEKTLSDLIDFIKNKKPKLIRIEATS